MTRLAWERRGAGPPLVLVHGLGYARWGWGPVPGLLERDFELVLLDNRGIGGSDVPPGPYTAADMARDVLGVLDEAGIDQAHVLGTSLGGMVAQELALAAPERLERLVLVCTTPGGAGAYPLPERTLALIREAASLEPAVALRRFVQNALAPDAPEALVGELTALRLANPPDPDGWQAQAAAGTTFDAFDRIGAIAAPTLVLHGTEDGVVDPRNAEVLAACIAHAEVELFDGGGHLFFWEQPERFADRVRRFLLVG